MLNLSVSNFNAFQIELVLGKILQELKKLHGSNQHGARNLPDLIDGTTGVAGTSGERHLPSRDQFNKSQLIS
jgi:hypothetical protein